MRQFAGTKVFCSVTILYSGLALIGDARLGASNIAPSEDRLKAGIRTEFLQKYCFECHDADTRKGDLDLADLKFEVTTPTNFTKWVLVHDRVSKGEMPPRKKERPDPAAINAFTSSLSAAL